MKKRIINATLLLFPVLAFSQDLELKVSVLPTSVLGDPVAFNIVVRNMDKDSATGVVVKVSLEKGLKFSGFTPNNLDFDSATGLWRIGSVKRYRAAVLTVLAGYMAREDAILTAEIIAAGGIDPDSIPGNGIDTNGNGKIIHDRGDEDDGDAAQNGPFKRKQKKR